MGKKGFRCQGQGQSALRVNIKNVRSIQGLALICHRPNIPGKPPPILAIIFENLPIFFIICCI